MPGKSLNDLDTGTNRTDDRWTLAKLAAVGWDLWLERRCRTCQEEIRIYRRDDPKAPMGYRTLIVDDATLEAHRCEDRHSR